MSRMRCSAKLLRSGAPLIRDRHIGHLSGGPGFAAHFVLRCARDTCNPSVQPKHPINRAHFRRADQAPVADRDRVQAAFELGLPELQEALQFAEPPFDWVHERLITVHGPAVAHPHTHPEVCGAGQLFKQFLQGSPEASASLSPAKKVTAAMRAVPMTRQPLPSRMRQFIVRLPFL